jgi:hypothetical protein
MASILAVRRAGTAQAIIVATGNVTPALANVRHQTA